MKIERIIQKSDGSEVRITAEGRFGIRLPYDIDVYVHRRAGRDQPWELLSDRPHPDWRRMSVAEYVKRGRSEVLQAVSVGQILHAASTLRSMLEDRDRCADAPGESREEHSAATGECGAPTPHPQDRNEWEDLMYEAMGDQVTRSDGQGIAEAQPDMVDTLYRDGVSPEEAAAQLLGNDADVRLPRPKG